VALVLLAMMISAWMTAPAPPCWWDLAHALTGTTLVIVGAIALNQRLEYQGDGRMQRTADRPLPAGRLSRRQVAGFGGSATFAGVVYLAATTNLSMTALAVVGWLLYVALYTPLKTRSAWQTPIGALAGAMPVLLGAAAVDGLVGSWGWILFGIVYFWQFPHSMAIAWRYRRDFAAAGVQVATVRDPSGRIAGITAVLGAGMIVPIALGPVFLGLAGMFYGSAAALLSVGYLVASVTFAFRPDDTTARWLRIASLVYLPLLLLASLAA
jgi:protoheme IX farnesyltransferase